MPPNPLPHWRRGEFEVYQLKVKILLKKPYGPIPEIRYGPFFELYGFRNDKEDAQSMINQN